MERLIDSEAVEEVKLDKNNKETINQSRSVLLSSPLSSKKYLMRKLQYFGEGQFAGIRAESHLNDSFPEPIEVIKLMIPRIQDILRLRVMNFHQRPLGWDPSGVNKTNEFCQPAQT